MTEIHETYNPTRKFLALKYLKVVEIKCHKEDKAVRQILKILNTFGVSSDQIDVQVIQHTNFSPSKFIMYIFLFQYLCNLHVNISRNLPSESKLTIVIINSVNILKDPASIPLLVHLETSSSNWPQILS
jgi:hypothetical protein